MMSPERQYKLADYSQAVTVDSLDTALREGGFDGVFHYLRGTPGFVVRVETPEVVGGIRDRGWPQAGIDLPRTPGDADGNALVLVAQWYGCPPGHQLYLDIEPDVFAQFGANAWAAAADVWAGQVRAGGYSPNGYGTDATLAACANRMDRIWRAKPGQCDPAGPGLDPAFFAGRRATQCGAAVIGGIEMDISFSEFPLGATRLRGGDGVLASSDAMQEPFWDVRIRAADQAVLLGFFAGGAGDYESFTGNLTELGRPSGKAAPVQAGLTFTTHVPGHLRVNVGVTLADGSEWLKIYGDEPGSVNSIVQDWTPAGVPANCPAVYVPAVTGAYVKHVHGPSDEGTPN